MTNERLVHKIKKYSGIGLDGKFKLEMELYGGGLYTSKNATSEANADAVLERIREAGKIHLDALKYHWEWSGRIIKK